MHQRGITRLYSHQAEAVEAVLAGHNVVVVTPTASGKTLCYNLPVLDRTLKDRNTRALYLFPTKALAQDQLSELYGLIQKLDVDIKTYTFDGDTPHTARRLVRSAGHIVITNPDMLLPVSSPTTPSGSSFLRISSTLLSMRCINIAVCSVRTWLT